MSDEETMTPETEENMTDVESPTPDGIGSDLEGAESLSQEERETIRELGNISMGAAASNLATLLGQDVDVRSEAVDEAENIDTMAEPLPGENKILICANYSGGMVFSTAYAMKTSDAKAIANMMMGGGEDDGEPLSELQASAITEAMNQMMNASAQSMASIISDVVEVVVPEVSEYGLEELKAALPDSSGKSFSSISYELKIGEDLSIDIVQIISTEIAKDQVKMLMAIEPDEGNAPPKSEEPEEAPGDTMASQPNMSPQPQANPGGAGGGGYAAHTGGGNPGMSSDPVTVQPVQFSPMDNQPNVYGEANKNLELVMDVSLNLAVELGKTEISIKEILELTRGSVIELDRIAGEPVDLLANGKLIAKGEVVVIEDNFGLRITSIISPADRLRVL